MFSWLLCGMLLANGGAHSPALPPPKEAELSGTIVSVGEALIVLMVGGGEGKQSFMVDKGATILIDNMPAELKDLREGDKVLLTVGPQGSVLSIRCSRSKANLAGLAEGHRQMPLSKCH